MKKDIKSRSDIERLVKNFYDKIKADELLGPIFIQIFRVDWEKHLPVIFDFWENTLFFTGSYSGNPVQIHRHIHSIFPLEEKHFQRWILIFNSTVDELFEGEKALLSKQRAISISAAMKQRLFSQNTGSGKVNFENL